MSAVVRPIYIPGAAACELLRSRAQAALDPWAREWMSAEASASVAVSAASGSAVQLSAGPWAMYRSDSGRLWCRRSVVDRASLARGVAGAASVSEAGECVDEWTDTLAERAAQARDHALCSALLGEPVEEGRQTLPDLSLFAFGSGALHVSCAAIGLHAIADAAVWRNVPPSERLGAERLPALTPLDRALQRTAVRMEAMLGSVEIPVSRLLELSCGDVVRLPDRLRDGLTLLCEGRPVARAMLGERRGRKCVQVMADEA